MSYDAVILTDPLGEHSDAVPLGMLKCAQCGEHVEETDLNKLQKELEVCTKEECAIEHVKFLRRQYWRALQKNTTLALKVSALEKESGCQQS